MKLAGHGSSMYTLYQLFQPDRASLCGDIVTYCLGSSTLGDIILFVLYLALPMRTDQPIPPGQILPQTDDQPRIDVYPVWCAQNAPAASPSYRFSPLFVLLLRPSSSLVQGITPVYQRYHPAWIDVLV